MFSMFGRTEAHQKGALAQHKPEVVGQQRLFWPVHVYGTYVYVHFWHVYGMLQHQSGMMLSGWGWLWEGVCRPTPYCKI